MYQYIYLYNTDSLRRNLQKNEIIKPISSYRFLINYIPTLESCSGSKYSEVLYDSEREGKDGTIFRKKKFTKNKLYYIEIDLHNDVFGHYQP